MTDCVAVLCTVDSAEAAERIAHELVERRLAACVNVVPQVLSVYRWQGQIERSEERLLLIKTTAARAEALRQAVVSLHPYDVPEVVVLPIVAGHEPYLAWLRESVG